MTHYKHQLIFRLCLLSAGLLVLGCSMPLSRNSSCGRNATILRSSYKSWPRGIVTRSIDANGYSQKISYYIPESPGDSTAAQLPLLISLHGWQQSWDNDIAKKCAHWCKKKRWAFISPDFGGPFYQGAAINSPERVGYIISALDFMLKHDLINPKSVFLIGVSGGASTALFTALSHPQRFKAVSTWVPITDLVKWHSQLTPTTWRYGKDLESMFKGTPSTQAAKYAAASPLQKLITCQGPAFDINAGILDGKTGPVPIEHSTRFYEKLCQSCAAGQGQLPAGLIETAQMAYALPDSLINGNNFDDYGPARLLYRSSCKEHRLNIFKGGHQIYPEPGLRWLESQL